MDSDTTPVESDSLQWVGLVAGHPTGDFVSVLVSGPPIATSLSLMWYWAVEYCIQCTQTGTAPLFAAARP